MHPSKNKGNFRPQAPSYLQQRPSFYQENGYQPNPVNRTMYAAPHMQQPQAGAVPNMPRGPAPTPNHQLLSQYHMPNQPQHMQQQQAASSAIPQQQQQQPQNVVNMAANGPVQQQQQALPQQTAQPGNADGNVPFTPAGRFVLMDPQGGVRPPQHFMHQQAQNLNGYSHHLYPTNAPRMQYTAGGQQPYLNYSPMGAAQHPINAQQALMMQQQQQAHRLPTNAGSNMFMPAQAQQQAVAQVLPVAIKMPPPTKERSNAIPIINPLTNKCLEYAKKSVPAEGLVALPPQPTVAIPNHFKELVDQKIKRTSESHVDEVAENVALPLPEDVLAATPEVAPTSYVPLDEELPVVEQAPIAQVADTFVAPEAVESPIPDMSVPPPAFNALESPCPAVVAENCLPIAEPTEKVAVQEQQAVESPAVVMEPIALEAAEVTSELCNEKSVVRSEAPVEPKLEAAVLTEEPEVVVQTSAKEVIEPEQQNGVAEQQVAVEVSCEIPAQESVEEIQPEDVVAIAADEPEALVTELKEVETVEELDDVKVAEKPVEVATAVVEDEEVVVESPAIIEEEVAEEAGYSDNNGRRSYARNFMMTLRDSPQAKIAPKIPENLQMLKRGAGHGGAGSGHGRSVSMMNTQTNDFSPGYMRGGAGGMNTSVGQSSSMMRGNHNSGSMKGTRRIAPRVIEPKASTTKPLKTVENAWKSGGAASTGMEKTKKTFRGILNKITPETLGKLQVDLKDLLYDNGEHFEIFAVVIHEKAVRETYFAPMYANITKFLIDSGPNKDAKTSVSFKFRAHMVLLCDREFKKAKEEAANKEKAEAILMEKLSTTTDPKEIAELQKAFDDKYRDMQKEELDKLRADIEVCTDDQKKKELESEYDTLDTKMRLKSVGLVTFYGQMYVKGIIKTAMVMLLFVRLVGEVAIPTSAEILCSLFLNTGADMYRNSDAKAKSEITQCVKQMKRQALVENDKRIKFMLMNATDLYDNHFVAKHKAQTVAAPSTKAQVKSKMENEELQINMNINNSTHNSGGNHNRNSNHNDRFRRGDRGSAGLVTGNTPNWDSHFKDSSNSSTKSRPMKLAVSSSNAEELKLGPSSSFSKWGRGSTGGGNTSSHGRQPQKIPPPPASLSTKSRYSAFGDDDDMDATTSLRPNNSRSFGGDKRGNNNGRMGGPIASPFQTIPRKPQPPAKVEAPVPSQQTCVACLDEYINLKNITEAVKDVHEKIKVVHLPVFINYTMQEFINVKSSLVAARSEGAMALLKHLFTGKSLTSAAVVKGLETFMAEFDELSCDCPKLGSITGEFVAELVSEKMMPFDAVWPMLQKSEYGSQPVLIDFLVKLTELCGKYSVLKSFVDAGLNWPKVFGGKKKPDVLYSKLSSKNISFTLSIPESNELGVWVQFVECCQVDLSNRSEVKDFLIALVYPAVKDNELSSDDILENRFEAFSRLEAVQDPKVQLNIIFALQGVCVFLPNGPQIPLLEQLFIEAQNASLVSVTSFEAWANSDATTESQEPYLGRCVTGTKTFRRELN